MKEMNGREVVGCRCSSSDERGAVPRSELRSVATQPIVSAAVADTPKLARRCAPG